ncbi:MAG: bifunctional DNA-formamidopyrimidine glycosylase/DNA-(apurinic or apyrimidinic site) lyase [Sphingomonadales bacterium]|nr:bifunctional DNA-formamidopyrimidine glycosylase/DNA-(apurinic or apyrimidinic site) lyase [Sphingomonadales bacterium]
MPELPEVETVCRGLAPVLEGRVLEAVTVRRPDLRFLLPPDFAERLRGRRVERIRRRAKFILMEMAGGPVAILHLGMSGRMRFVAPGEELAPGRHDHLIFGTDHGYRVVFNDARRFGIAAYAEAERLEEHEFLADLGPEPLSNAFSGPVLAAALSGRRTPIKAALLDQRVVAGLGNIYVCEALYRAGLSPRRRAYTVQKGRAERLAAAVRQVLTDAIAAGGTTLRDFARPDGELGYFQHAFRVYGREGQDCPREGCSGAVRRIVQSGRSSFFCPTCQR